MHGRDRKDPWSFRNLAVYQRLVGANQADWLFISLPSPMRDHLEERFSNMESCEPHSILGHVYILTTSIRNWRWYLNYLEDEFKELVRILQWLFL